ncbi:MAG: C40 family peptidase [Candidatus Protistobacter heckmanni]|nr:C40 family peptidase [Candidatus Protistobacter heckmanni]
MGTPYRYGGNTPAGGLDCSGLVGFVVNKAVGLKLPRTTTDIGARGYRVERSALAAGDLVFFNTLGDPHSHVGIHVGRDRFVHAPKAGGTVRLEDMTKSYWADRFTEARRLVGQADSVAASYPR